MSESFVRAQEVTGEVGSVREQQEREAPVPQTPPRAASARALLVAREPDALDAVSQALADAGFEVAAAVSAAAALAQLQDAHFDLVLLDVMLPDAWGIDLVPKIRAGGNDVPLIVFGAGDSEADRVLSLELGADDFVTTPFSPRELVSRGRAILRRVRREQTNPSIQAVGSLRVDVARHEVLLGQRSVDVTVSEFRLLALLSASPGNVFSRRQIMEHLWAGPYFGDGHPADTHVLNLRRKIESDPSHPTRLLTVRGIGFRLVAPACEAVSASA